jgi:hypothetical protein
MSVCYLFLLSRINTVRRQPHAAAAFTPRGNPWYSFLEAESTPGHMVPSVATEKIPSVTPPGIDPGTIWLVAQCLNHYTTPSPYIIMYINIFKDVTCPMFCLHYVLEMMLQLKLSSFSCIAKIQHVPDFQNTILTTYKAWLLKNIDVPYFQIQGGAKYPPYFQ